MTEQRTRVAEPSSVAAVCDRRFLVVLLALLVPAFFAPTATAGERNVTAAEANGTYRDVEGKREIKILAVGHGKLKVQLALVYEYKSGAGPMANLGDASGEATIENDIAVFVPEEAGDCKITMTFLPNGKLKVKQQGDECGFGPQRPRRRHLSENQQPQTKVRRRLMRIRKCAMKSSLFS